MRVIVLSGLTWSAAWLATSHIFSRVPRNEITRDTGPLLEEPSPMEKHNPRSERSTRPDIF
jgi:lipoprotein NlpI